MEGRNTRLCKVRFRWDLFALDQKGCSVNRLTDNERLYKTEMVYPYISLHRTYPSGTLASSA